jgi:hypothetical protein
MSANNQIYVMGSLIMEEKGNKSDAKNIKIIDRKHEGFLL